MKKRVVAAALLLTLCLSGCGQEKKDTKTKTTEQPVATIKVVDLPEDLYLTIKDQVYTATGGALQMTVPKEWKVSEDDATILVAGTKEDTKDFVSVQVADKDKKFAEYKQDSFDAYYNRIFDNYQAESFTKTTVQGLPAWCLKYTFSKDDADITGYEYLIDGNYTYLIGFTDVSGELEPQIESILNSVVICK